MRMRKLLLVPILALFCTLSAKSTLSLAMSPQKQTYALSLEQQSPASSCSVHLSFSAPDDLVILLPSRLRIRMGDSSIRVGYTGFWAEYALQPEVGKWQSLVFERGNHALALLTGKNTGRALGYEHRYAIGNVSVLAWMQAGKKSSSFQTEWTSDHARWGVAGSASLSSKYVAMHSELLFSPIQGLSAFVSSSCRYGSSTLGFAYGEQPYPARYSFALDLASNALSGSFLMEDWFGSKPIYGGFSTPRKRRQSTRIRFSLGRGYLLFSFSDTYVFTRKGLEAGSVTMQGTWGGPFGQLSAQYGTSRILSSVGQRSYSLSLNVHKATLSYTQKGYEITLTDSAAIGRGIGTWRLTKRMGEPVFLSLLYSVTSDR